MQCSNRFSSVYQDCKGSAKFGPFQSKISVYMYKGKDKGNLFGHLYWKNIWAIKVTVHPGKTQISLGIRPGWSESWLCAQWVIKVPKFLHADREDSDQTGRMPRLIWVFAGGTRILLVLSCCGSFGHLYWNNIFPSFICLRQLDKKHKNEENVQFKE